MSGPGRALAAGAAGVVVLVVLVAAAAGGTLGGMLGGTGAATAPSADALSAIPASYLALYQQATATCPGLSWTVLAAIGTVESDNGQSTLPGVKSGANAAGAMGPLQMLGATFAAYDQPVPTGGANPPSPYDPVDAVYAATRMLCANGGRNDTNLTQAVWDYNHSESYVTEVLDLAARYGQAATAAAPSAAAATALAYALSQLGTPYRFGGETPGVGFDCSGLIQAAYAAAGITLPRVAQAQYDVGPHLPPGGAAPAWRPRVLRDLDCRRHPHKSGSTSASRTARRSWSTRHTPARRSASSRSRRPSGRGGVTRCVSARRRRDRFLRLESCSFSVAGAGVPIRCRRRCRRSRSGLRGA